MDDIVAVMPMYRNGWLTGFAVACAAMICFVVYSWGVSHLLEELLMVGAPIGAALGALVGVNVDPRSLPRRRRIGMSLSIIAGFASYCIGLMLYLASHV